jgi:hypothetical protein
MRTCLLADGGLFADGHTHPWSTRLLVKSRASGPLTWVGQHSRRAFAPFFRPVYSRSYRVTTAEVERAYQAISRRDGVRVLPATAAFVEEHREHGARGIWRASPRSLGEQCVSTSSAAARTDSRHGNCAWLGSGSSMRSSPPSFLVATWPRRSSPGAWPS